MKLRSGVAATNSSLYSGETTSGERDPNRNNY